MKNDLKIEIDLKNFEVDFNSKVSTTFDTRYIKPKYTPDLKESQIKYKKAQDLSDNIEVAPGNRYFVIVDGKFIFGDLIEAIIVDRNLLVEEMLISTLSISENNIDSLANLINGDFVQKLSLIVSDYFFSHERNNLIDYAYKELDIDDKFQLAVAASHCKLCLIKSGDLKIVIHGSANLRSSSNIEQFVIEVNNELYDFLYSYQNRIVEHYKTINKSIRYKKLWHLVNQ